MSIYLVYDYFNEKDNLSNKLIKKSEITLNRIKTNIEPYISSYAINEYEKTILNEMMDEEIYAVTIEDYVTGSILGKKSFTTTKIQGENGNILDTNNVVIENNYFLEVTSIINSIDDKTEIGTIKLYFTDKYLKEELNALILKSIVITSFIAVFLIIFLYIALRAFILKPLNTLSSFLANKDKNGLPKKFQITKGSKEITDLSISMNEMIKQITSSKEEIDKLNERFDLTLEAVKDGIWDWNIQTGETYFSKRWKTMLGYRVDELENSVDTFKNLIHVDDKDKVEENLDRHFKNPSKYPYNIEVRLKCKDGSYKWILSRGKVYLDENNPVRMLGYHTDITKEKENDKYQKQQEKVIAEQAKLASMGEMIGNIAHQWRQPLSVISTGATGMKLQKEFNTLDDDTFNKTCDIINENAQYLSKTIDDFREFIKGNTNPIKFNLKNRTDSFINLVDSTIKKHNIQVILDLEEHIDIKGFPNELVQCFINIFNNAKDALNTQVIDDEKYIFISQHIVDNKIIIEFKDNAGGISEDILSKIFEPYFTTKHQSQGTGLGLHMTYNLIVHGMNGNIKAFNDTYTFNNKEYRGAKFTIELPLKS